ncbi:hypothetical protein Acid345_3165 [Candidatus Koribacter versatilis Ellin345]|uniref:Uncharacterized protein n=1 Tax=Koribacter versatilis (strain Ellin345) TaxID=204669 RepID=Q1ILT4_KORVE|nr:hypothetical protein [Candidatus Koribacter versatilis]ABF42166.1 hypothetical protein Acid345_3165 [Candidatus Koribacter versatilis Ellin345]
MAKPKVVGHRIVEIGGVRVDLTNTETVTDVVSDIRNLLEIQCAVALCRYPAKPAAAAALGEALNRVREMRQFQGPGKPARSIAQFQKGRGR